MLFVDLVSAAAVELDVELSTFIEVSMLSFVLVVVEHSKVASASRERDLGCDSDSGDLRVSMLSSSLLQAAVIGSSAVEGGAAADEVSPGIGGNNKSLLHADAVAVADAVVDMSLLESIFPGMMFARPTMVVASYRERFRSLAASSSS